jgi:hypothetical protein
MKVIITLNVAHLFHSTEVPSLFNTIPQYTIIFALSCYEITNSIVVEIRLLQAIQHGQTFHSSNETSRNAVWASEVTNGSSIQSNEEVGMAVHERLQFCINCHNT